MCYYCGTLPDADSRDKTFITRDSVCQVCQRDLRVCLNCKFYEDGAHWDCRESQIPDQVAEKERSNFCDYFSYIDKLGKKEVGKVASEADTAKNNFLNLFGEG